MVIYDQTDLAKWSRAILKARLTQPTVQVIATNYYRVSGVHAEYYVEVRESSPGSASTPTVTAEESSSSPGSWQLNCSCQAGERERPCYHCAAVALTVLPKPLPSPSPLRLVSPFPPLLPLEQSPESSNSPAGTERDQDEPLNPGIFACSRHPHKQSTPTELASLLNDPNLARTSPSQLDNSKAVISDELNSEEEGKDCQCPCQKCYLEQLRQDELDLFGS